MNVTEFNALSRDDALSALVACAAVPAWAAQVADGRPYADTQSLLAHADRLAAAWTDDEVDAALADHPRLGENHAGTGASADASAREQAALRASADPGERLAAGNRLYEQRFGRVYLVRAAGRTAAEILALLDERLGNDPATELRVVARELREICALRLAGLLDHEPVSATLDPTGGPA